ncbi:LytTR family transcriptional regulator DNA-binding domain-containing protein [Paenibacillus sp. SC116]|uniref:LytTR family transcriptional regulator DNA-binding domain-containing protein n=1 Tax=Paenibacillus sp. SC116 TaxID=2968986 RepID=UPI00215ABAAA|nr:LytTR family transcriptional regulator DNA-binding domain-containing protein [Paenibacillus sp. SC116]MCR8842428.1 LytTR family transcriptional regulator DNA-binding domain-containing protein [Paenibacillus sp. SC116]
MAVLTIDHLIKRQGNAPLLPEINLQITSGQCVVIQCNNELGHLLIQLLLGDIPASSGHVLIESENLPQTFKKKAHKIGVSFLDDGHYGRLKVKDSLTFYKDIYQATISIDEVLHKIGLEDKQNSKISSLTFSEKKRLNLGKTIIHNPMLLIWEEPEQNVDMESHIIIRALLTELLNEGKAILITTSYLADAISITNEVYRLNEHEFKKLDVIDDSVTDPQTDITITIGEHPSQTVILPPTTIEVRPVRVERIPAKVDDKIILFDPTEINFIEISEGISILHVKGATFPCVFTLNDLESKLKPLGFFRCHRSYIVNLQKVREVITWTRNSFGLILDDDKKSSIPLSKGKYDELKGALGI